MAKHKSDFLNTLDERGFIHQCSDFAGLDALAAQGKAIGYIGFDCTAPSFHVGNMIVLMMLHWLQATGNKPIVLMGGGTTRVGDPSGKDETRKILPIEQIEANKASMQRACAKLMRFGVAPARQMSEPDRRSRWRPHRWRGIDRGVSRTPIMLDNAEWLTRLNYIEMLRDVGRHFSVNRMLAMDSVKSRLERDQEMSFIEFNYQVLQAYDFTVLARTQGCNLQMGASDQWGNIVTGIDLGRRMGTHQLYALTTPLLTTSSGAKMGKSVAGAVWLNEDMLGAYDFWQYWRNAEDADVGRFLRLFTTLPMAEIARLSALQGAEINEAKKALATEVTAMLHGRDKAEAAARTAQQTFEQGTLAQGLPTVDVSAASELAAGLGMLTAFVKAGLVKSNGEARRQIAGGGLRVNDEAISNEAAKLTPADVPRRRGQALARPQAPRAAEAGVGGRPGAGRDPRHYPLRSAMR